MVPDAMRAAFDDPRPKVRLPGDDWLLSETAAALGQHLADKSLFLQNGEIVLLEEVGYGASLPNLSGLWLNVTLSATGDAAQTPSVLISTSLLMST